MDSLQERIDRAQPGDTLTIRGGVYEERIVIDKPLTLEGAGRPVIDGGGEGDVVTISGDDVTLSGFVVRNSGRAVSQEPAAVKVVDAHAPTIRDNRIESSHFGIHVTGAHHATIAFNRIDAGSGVPQERRGHAVYLWEVMDSVVHSNDITNAADGIHLEFSEHNGIGQNSVTGSRYALHFMYSSSNTIIGNVFRDNLAGAVLMFSNDLLLKDNELSGNRRGATGAGILIKDADNIFVEGNRILRNKYGLSAEGVPQSEGATATFLRNLFALNDTGVGLMSTAPITFVENAMIENTVQVQALGGSLLSTGEGPGASVPPAATGASGQTGHEGHAAGATTAEQPAGNAASDGAVWAIGGRGNYWSDYRGYDADGDGVGDQPYRPEPAFAGAMDDHPTLRLFQFTIAQQAIDTAADMFPVYQYDPVIEDASPLMSPPGPALPDQGGVNGSLLAVSVLLVGLSGVALQLVLGVDPIDALARGGRRAAGYFNRGAAS
jgi:nitrous oxidase accessory protein